MASWNLKQLVGGVDHTYLGDAGGQLTIRSDPGVSPLTIAKASVTDYLGEILATADNFPSARRPQSRYRRILNSTGWTESYGSTTMTFPSTTAASGVEITVTATSEVFRTGEVVAYCQNVLTLCDLDVAKFQQTKG